MRKDLTVSLGIMTAMVAFASSANWWLPQLLKFVGTNGNLIQSLADSIQILLWIGVLSIFIVKPYLKSSKAKNSKQIEVIHSENINVKNPASTQPKRASKYSVEAENIIGLVQGEKNNITIHFKNDSPGG